MKRKLGEGSAPITHADVDVMLSELYAGFLVKCDLKVSYRGDCVQTIVVGTRTELEIYDAVKFQALRSVSIKSNKSLEKLFYESLWDVYMQFDKWASHPSRLPKDASEPPRKNR